MRKTVAIIGAGPVGLAAAAHSVERGLNPIVLEAGPAVGHAVQQWKHVRLFSPWAKNIDQAARRLLERVGWDAPDPEAYMTGAELIERYLRPLATQTALSDSIKTSARVTGVARFGVSKLRAGGRLDTPFELRYRIHGREARLIADAVIDTSGVWFRPNPAGSNGLPAIGENAHSRCISYGMPDLRGSDRSRYVGRAVAVLGTGHSAMGTLIELAHLASEEPTTQVTWILRGVDVSKTFGRGPLDRLSARAELGAIFADLVSRQTFRVETGFQVRHVSSRSGRLRISEGPDKADRSVVVDELIVSTGFRPDLSFLSELRLDLDPGIEAPSVLAPLVDPNLHTCGTVRPHGFAELAHKNEPGFYIAGIKSYGRAPTFLMLTGYEQVRSIVAELAGDREAAAKVELILPPVLASVPATLL